MLIQLRVSQHTVKFFISFSKIQCQLDFPSINITIDYISLKPLLYKYYYRYVTKDQCLDPCTLVDGSCRKLRHQGFAFRRL